MDQFSIIFIYHIAPYVLSPLFKAMRLVRCVWDQCSPFDIFITVTTQNQSLDILSNKSLTLTCTIQYKYLYSQGEGTLFASLKGVHDHG